MLTLGLAIAFVVEFVRALPWPERWKRRKPLSCNACMTSWALLAYSWWAFNFDLDASPSQLLASAGVALLTLALLKHWQGLNLSPPE